MPASHRHIRIGLIVEDKHSDAYRVLTQKIFPERVRGYPIRKNKTIPASPRLRSWIEQVRDKYDFVFVLVDADTPLHRRSPTYFTDLRRICDEAGAALLIVKIELESWLLADVDSIARWKKSSQSLRPYPDTTHSPQDPKSEIVSLINRLNPGRQRRRTRTYNPQWTAEIAQALSLNEETRRRNKSLKCFYDLVRGCGGQHGQAYFDAYPHQAHCNTVD